MRIKSLTFLFMTLAATPACFAAEELAPESHETISYAPSTGSSERAVEVQNNLAALLGGSTGSLNDSGSGVGGGSAPGLDASGAGPATAEITENPLPINPDIDGDGLSNRVDWDIDGDGKDNEDDSDMDGDGTLNEKDKDMDGDGLESSVDPNIDGDLEGNHTDDDIDGDGVLNEDDKDDDGDGIEDTKDSTPGGFVPSPEYSPIDERTDEIIDLSHDLS